MIEKGLLFIRKALLRFLNKTPQRKVAAEKMVLSGGQQFFCPYCASPNTAWIEADSRDHSLVQDCEVCCRPVLLRLHRHSDGFIELDVRAENE